MSETIYETIKDSDGVECFIKRGNLVRCKDCKHYNIIGCAGGFGWCERYDVGHTDEWFCADGVAKDINVPGKEGR